MDIPIISVNKLPTQVDLDRPAPAGTPFHFATVLAERLPRTRKRPKRLRTKAQILCATAVAMEQVGYEGLTVDLIAESAGIARGTFYLHFQDRSKAAMTVIRAYSALVTRARPRGGRRLNARDAIRLMNAYYIRVYALNAKLLVGGESLLRDRPELTALRDRGNFEWAQSILRDLRVRSHNSAEYSDENRLHLKIRAVIAMIDEIMREIFLFQVKTLAHYAENEELLVDVLSEIWYQSLHQTQS